MAESEYTVSTELNITARSIAQAIEYFLDDATDEALEIVFVVDGQRYLRGGARVLTNP